MPTGIGSGIAGDVFQNLLGDGSGGGGGLVCPSRYSWLGDGINIFGQQAGTVYTLGAVNSSLSFWYKPIDIKGPAGLGAGLLTTDGINLTSTDPFNIYTSASGVLTASLGPMTFPAHPELITNGSFSNVPVGTELIANPTFSDAASITPWNINGPNATKSWSARFMRLDYTVAAGNALLDYFGHTLNTMYSVKMRVRGVTAVGADQGSAFSSIGELNNLGQVISNPTLTSEYQDYEFRVWSTGIAFRFYLASAAIGDVVDFDSISVKPLTMLVDNGNFGNGTTDWTDEGDSDIVVGTYGGRDDVANIDINDANTTSKIQQPFSYVEGKSYKVTVDVYLVSGSFRADCQDGFFASNFVSTTSIGSWETLTGYFTALQSGSGDIWLRSNNEIAQFYVDSISVDELGEDWTLFPNVEPIFNASGLTLTTANGNDQTLFNQDVVDSGKSYKVTYEITAATYTTGSVLKYYDGDSYVAFPEQGVGTHTFYYTAENPSLSSWYMKLTRGTGTDTVTISSLSVEEVLSEDEWHHLALSIDRDSEWKWYVDGVLTNTMDNATDQAPTVGFSFLGLSSIGLSNGSFYGNMTEPSLWNIPLSASEVKDIYDNMYGGQRCLGSLPFTSDLITNGNFTQIGPELITNPNFTDTGSELVVNGDFATDSDWTKIDGATISGGKAHIDGDGTTFTSISQASIFTEGKSYIVTADVTITSGLGLKFQDGANNENIGYATTSGSYTFYFVATSDATLVIGRRTGGTAFESSVDNVSVKELGEDWDIGMSDASPQTATKYVEILASGCRIVSDDTATPYVRVLQTALETGKNYKGSVSVTNSDTGKIRANFGGVNSDSFIDGSNTFYASETSNVSVSFLRNANDVDTTFTHVSAKEVGQGWTVANRDTTHYVEFPGVGARFVSDTLSPVLELQQLGIITPGKSYTVTCHVAYAVGSGKIKVYVGGDESSSLDEGFNTVTLTATGSDYFSIKRNDPNVDCVITNVTLTQVGGGNLERWWRMNGLEPLLIDLPNVAPNGIVDDLNEINSPGISPDVP